MVKCHLDVGNTIPECNILNANKCTRQMARFNFSMDFSWLVAMCSESASSIFKVKSANARYASVSSFLSSISHACPDAMPDAELFTAYLNMGVSSKFKL